MTDDETGHVPLRHRAEGAALPLSLADVAPHFACLARYRRVVLALSGGPDSTALLHLASAWVAARREAGALVPDLHAATVDHALRAESADEARFVAGLAAGYGVPHSTLVWQDEKPKSALMAAARAARYRLLATLAARDLPAAIVTAHTEDDQGETVLMRLARGSGLDGLGGMAPCRPSGLADEVDLVRPLLGFGKARLVATLRAAGLPWIEDPSNASAAFERVRWRAARDTFDALGLTNEKIAASAARLRRVQAAIDAAVADFIVCEVDLHQGIFASFERRAFDAAPEEIRIRVLAELLDVFGGSSAAARLVEVEALAARLADGGSLRVTLGGAVVSAGERFLRVYREHARRPLPAVRLAPGEQISWDERFEVAADASASAVVVVRGLGEEAYATLMQDCRPEPGIPGRAAAGLPSFWTQGGSLISVPQLGYLGSAGGGVVPDQGHFRARFLGFAATGGASRRALQSKPR